ncbi:MAG: gamma-glutamyltransferase [Gemmatimonadota bacterium]|nr:gamma-glutamyltransferase [Gemmatimonadota bacterium]MDH5760354.1 gamma-glutamyltransferase [Gemmatimonadota bacterium]
MRHIHILAASAVLVATACGAPRNADAPATGPDPLFPAQNRPDVRGTHGAVSADHPLAAQAGLAVLREGGTAMDAVVAMAGVLAVVRPHMNGVGGDAFGIFYDGATGQVTALNGSGRSGALAQPSFYRDAGHDAVPETGALSVSVPGAVAAWVDAHQRYGRLPFARLLDPAVGYARDGFPVSTRLASDFEAQSGSLDDAGRAQYLPGGTPPAVGSLLKNPALARTLEGIARSGKAGFYAGPVAERLGAFLEAEGGHVRASDLAAHTSTWVDPLQGDYLDHTFFVLPPNTQGMAQLALFGMARSFAFAGMEHNGADYLHHLIEMKKLAFADRDRWAADPEHADIPLAALLDADYLAARAARIDPAHAATEVAPGIDEPSAAPGSASDGRDDSGDTVYLTAVDQWGNAVSWIQSLYAGFGSGLFEPETGIMLQNRGALYTLEDGHPNQVAPGKRPYHTLTPMLAMKDGALAFTLGTPGGDSQTQSLIQITQNLLLFGMTPQEAIEAPRFRSMEGTGVVVEDRIAPAVRARLQAMGHEVRVIHGWTATFGGAQMIRVEPGSGTLAVGSDPRREAYGLAY